MTRPPFAALCGALALVLAAALPAAHAADEAKAPTAQQQRMKQCNADASGKSGDERKAFMKDCLAGKTAAAEPAATPQQARMKQCNADAKGKAGDERKAFMKDCLSTKKAG
jgi:hypothetical protein